MNKTDAKIDEEKPKDGKANFAKFLESVPKVKVRIVDFDALHKTALRQRGRKQA